MTLAYNDDIRATSNEQRATVEVYVATHKPIDFPLPDYCKRIQVNAEANGQWPGYLHDNDSPDNISLKNPNYAELTALYSMWKNCKADIQGLYHYRRYISGRDEKNYGHDWQIVITENEAQSASITEQKIINALNDADIILVTPIQLININVHELFLVAVYCKDLQNLYRIIEEKYPDYFDSFNHVMNGSVVSQGNMFIAGQKFVDGYCAWLFDVLAELVPVTSLEGSDSIHRRIYGVLSELLLNVYIHKHNLRVKTFHKAIILPVSTANRLLRKIPVVMTAKSFLRKITWRKLTGLDDLLAAHPNAEKVKSYMLSAGASKAGGFLCLSEKHNDYGHMYIADLMPENESDNFIPKLEELMSAMKAESEKGKCELIPRVIISSGTPESVKRSLFELGVRLLEY